MPGMVDGYDGFLVHRIDAEKQEYGTRFEIVD
jgi:hypothetical protein